MSEEATIKAKIPQAWAVAVIAALTTAIGGGAVGQYRIAQLEDRAGKIETRADSRSETDQKQALQLQRIEDSVESIKDQLKQLTRASHR